MSAEPRYRRAGSLQGGKRRRFRLPYPVAYAIGALAGLTTGSILGAIVNAMIYGSPF